MIATYARRDATLIATAGGLVTVLVAWWAGAWGALPLILTLALLAFYRDPSRRPPQRPGLILAPADGRIAVIETASDAEGQRRLRIVVFLSVFNVHINRSPCAGRVIESTHRPGRFINALRNEADELNEHHTITIEPRAPLPGPIRVRQIAGALAKRIVCAAKIGDELAAGQRYGMIKLGSRTEVSLPDDGRWQLVIRIGQPVRAGLSVLAVHSPTERGTIPTS